MRYTPVELRHVNIGKSFFRGYKRADVERLLDDVADSFEEVWRERGELADKLEDVEKALGDLKQREQLLATTLVAAEKTAAEAVEHAKQKAELIVAEAHQEGRSITRAAQNERERLFAEARRVETLLRSALGMVEETRAAPSADDGAPEMPLEDLWPNRQDTSEFEAIDPEADLSGLPQLPPVQPVTPEDGDDEPPAAGRDFTWE